MAFLYDLEPGVIVETENPLDEQELEKARADYLERPSKRRHEAVAQALGGTVYKPGSRPVARVAVDPAELAQLLKRAYPDERERARIEEQIRG